jgi:hypothetical protein
MQAMASLMVAFINTHAGGHWMARIAREKLSKEILKSFG